MSDGYDGFVSYSHAADGLLAPRLQTGLQRFAKPWWKRRALRIFRDESSLSASPHLWSSITEAMDSSQWFVLLMSPEAAASEWVNQEIEYWRAHRDPSRILPVLSDGGFGWDGADVTGSAVPEALRGAFDEEPRWVDLREVKSDEHLDLKNPAFADAVADVASALRGVLKDELASEEVKQHRRTVRSAWGAAGLVGALAVAATLFGIQASSSAREADRQAELAQDNAAEAQSQQDTAEANAAEAEAQREKAEANAEAEAAARAEADENAQLAKARELASAAAANLERNPELATLLALEALRTAPGDDVPPPTLINAMWQAGSANRLVGLIETGFNGGLDLSDDGTILAAITSPNTLRVFDTTTHEVLWEFTEDTVDHFVFPRIGPNGMIALPVFDSEAEWGGPVDNADDLPNRVHILTGSGNVVTTLEFPECLTAGTVGWAPDGAFLAVTFFDDPCGSEPPFQWVEVFETETWSLVTRLEPDGLPFGVNVRFDSTGRLHVLRSFESNLILAAGTFENVSESSATGLGDVSADGTRMYGYYTLQGQNGEAGSPFSVLAFDSATGTVADILYSGSEYPTVPGGVIVTGDGEFVIVTTLEAVFLYDPVSGELRFTIPTAGSRTVAYDGANELLYTSSDDGPRIWSIGARNAGVESTGDLGTFTWVNGNSFRMGPGLGALAAIDRGDGTWKSVFFDLASGEITDSRLNWVPRAALATGGFLLADTETEGFVIFDPSTGQTSRFFDCANLDEDLGCTDPGHFVDVSLDGSEMLAFPLTADGGDLTGESLTLDPADGGIVSTRELEFLIVHEAFTEEWIMGSPTSRIDLRVVDRETGELLWQDERGHLRHETSASAANIATWSGDSSLQIIDTSSWTSFSVDGFSNIRGVAFSPDGRTVAVGDDATLYIIDVETGGIAQQMGLAGVSDAHWIDSETLLVGTKDGLFGTLSISTDAFVEDVRSRLRRGFTEQECATFRIDPCPTLEELRRGRTSS